MTRVPPPAGACESASVQAGSEATCSSTRSAWCRETARSVLRMMSHSEGGTVSRRRRKEQGRTLMRCTLIRRTGNMNISVRTTRDAERWVAKWN